MFEPLFARLSDRYHLVAPDYPDFGHSSWPDPKIFAYTFDHITEIVKRFTEALRLSLYTLYMQDRLVLAHPDRVEALIIQNAVAQNEGLGAIWNARRAFWADRAANERALRLNFISLDTTRTRHMGNDPEVDRYDPDLWTDEFSFLTKPGQADIQADLFFDYRTNVDNYPKWQAWMRDRQPRLLVIWGRYDPSFDLSELSPRYFCSTSRSDSSQSGDFGAARDGRSKHRPEPQQFVRSKDKSAQTPPTSTDLRRET